MHSPSIISASFIFGFAFLLTGCGGGKTSSVAAPSSSVSAAPAEINQLNLCEVSDWSHDAVAAACKPGQKLAYLPKSFGNEQLPVIFAAVNCDLRYAVALTNGAVSCIYQPITPTTAPAQK